MAQTLQAAHPILAVLLLLLYAILAIRMFRQQSEEISSLIVTLSQSARLCLLLTYMSGLLLTMNFGGKTTALHHYASLSPVVVIFFYQFLPQARRKPLSTRGYAFMFLFMLLTILLISLSDEFPNGS